MKLKTSLFNRGLFTQDLRNVGWVSVGYMLCLLFALPLQLLMLYTNQDPYRQSQVPESLFAISSEFQIMMTFIFPVLLAIFLFRYIHVKLASDFIHSLPITRGHLLNQHVVIGILILLAPILVTGVSLLVLGQFLPYTELLTFATIFQWGGVMILFSVFVFLAGVFVAMFTGMSLLQGAFTYILFVFPVGVTVLFLSNLEFYLFGFTSHYYLTQQFERMIPFIRMTQLDQHPLTYIEVTSYIVISLLFYLCALLVYKKRQSESATQAIAFEKLRPIFKFGVTFCSMLVGGIYFSSYEAGLGWILFGYITASILGYIVATMILEKTWRVFDKWKGYVVYAVIITILGMSFQIDILGFEKKVPNVDEVQGVYFGDSIFYILDPDPVQSHDSMMERVNYIEASYYFEEAETIENIVKLHEQIILEKEQLQTTADRTNSVAIRYDMKNGDQIVRYYQMPIEPYQKLYRAIIETEEYKNKQNPILQVKDLSNLNRITIDSYRTGKQVTITEREDIIEFHLLLQQDVADQSIEDLNDDRYWSSEIKYEFKENKWLSLSWKKSYTLIEDWLEEKGMITQARQTPEDISYAYVIKNEQNRDMYDMVYSYHLEHNFAGQDNVIKVEDNKQLEELLRQSGGDHRGDYIIGYFYKQSSYPEFETLKEGQVPGFILEKISE
ncbi:DUF6449 domain-containing protein [Halalkalibacter krulwichiae]|uniref:DUF6449 domain-containing protein n=1 Tax=Halalkalibacter krulwichiae TaxID=199441 RepID=A0A1X9M887_9BACI|nr:DUF6449 domain-containing protein [Halalkalibacter krulwichiae]ARK29638.1 hypothetical protein BkAM31D_07060 [Halalkalibacter krulwichiae]